MTKTIYAAMFALTALSASETVVVDLCGREVSTVAELVTGKIVAVKAGKFTFMVPPGGIAIFEVAR